MVFVLKSFLQECREKNIDTWVLFIDLVKTYDLIQYKVIKKTLKILRALADLITWMMKLYNKFCIILKVRDEELSIPYGCGVK